MKDLTQTIVRSNVLIEEYNDLKKQFDNEVDCYDNEIEKEINYLSLVAGGLGAIAEERGAWSLQEFAEATVVILGSAMHDIVVNNENYDDTYGAFFAETVDSEDYVEMDGGNILLSLIADVLLTLEGQQIEVTKDLLLKKGTMLNVIDALCGDIEITVK